jgi:hypothetical protein
MASIMKRLMVLFVFPDGGEVLQLFTGSEVLNSERLLAARFPPPFNPVVGCVDPG